MTAQVLLVDDSRFAGKMIAKMLADKGVECIHVISAASLFGFKGQPSRLRELHPDAILLDIMMPEMDGMDVLRKLRAMPSLKDTPILMLSASANERNVTQAVHLGADGFLSKPVESDKLISELSRVAGKSPHSKLAETLAVQPKAKDPENADDERFKAGLADLTYLRNILDGDMDMVHELIGVFIEDMPVLLTAIAKAVANQDATALRAAAHRFKGSAGNLGAPLVVELARQLELRGEQGALEDAPAIFDRLKETSQKLGKGLADWLAANPT